MNTIDTYFPYAEYRPGQRRMLEVAATVARDGGRVRREMKEGGIADANIYATALRHRAKVVTGDPHFRGMPEVILMGEGCPFGLLRMVAAFCRCHLSVLFSNCIP